jgi:ferredoxin
MNIDIATMVCFSPTGTTKKILKSIIEGLQVDKVRPIDLTLPDAKNRDFKIKRHDLAVIGAPVYAGRIPGTAVQRLRQLTADKTPAVIVVVYGNRDYEDALLELSEIVRDAGFIPVAAAAFIGEHSYSTAATPIAVGRPDAQDLKQARDFGAAVRKKMEDIQTPDACAALPLPGNYPYKNYGAWPEMSPVILEDICNLCGECAAVCPTGAITVDAAVLTDKNKCITCCACVKICPLQARVMEEPVIKQIAQWLSTTYRERKTPNIFM